MFNLRQYAVINSIPELWKKEKQFKPFIFTFMAFLFLVSAIYLTLGILTVVYKEDLITSIQNFLAKNNQTLRQEIILEAATSTVTGLITMNFIIASLALLLNIYYIDGVRDSYKNQNFSRLKGSVTFLSSFYVLFIIISLVLNLIRGGIQLEFQHPILIAGLVIKIVLVVGWFLIGAQVRNIRQLFISIEQRIAFAKFVEQMNANGGIQNPFFASAATQMNNQPAQEVKNEQEVKQEKTEDKPMDPKLMELSRERLESVAKKMNIIGYEQLSDDELRNAINQKL
ncbi:hypothetical protein [Mycoplasma sp. Ms02]|uniref:hypothetical protein n=1 Tax=Mycoplasma sp. Ms02 TaxID=353851 RepID=UPI001C8A1A7C|nr:hypothetical protein [Mycoplasma sp. Ms02]QZE12599.1 hypothetical protein K4L35_01265 [Mycoplasma sp. Ms02]